MIRFSYEETITAPPSDVFARMTDVSHFDDWLDMDGRPVDPGPIRLGSRFESTDKLGPFKVHGTGEVTRFESDRAFGFRMTMPSAFDFVLDLELENLGGATRLTGGGTMTTHRLWRLLEPLLRIEVPEGEAREARRLKALVEAAG